MGQLKGTTQGSNRFQYLVESVCRAFNEGRMPNTEDVRQLFTQIQMNVQAALPGQNWLVPGGAKASGAAAPVGVQFSVSGDNGVFQGSITNPSTYQGRTVWHEVSYCALKSFTKDVITMSPTAGTSLSLSLPNQSYYFRVRSSFDLVNWSDYQLSSSQPISSGLVSSAATSEAGAFNQTNYGIVTSAAIGATAEVSIHGASGPLTSLVAQKGPTQSSLPGATIIGVTPGSDQFVGFDGQKYVLRNTLADLLADDGITPIGKVSVVQTGTPVLPTVALVLGAGGAVIGWNVLTQGNGLTGPVTLTIVTAGGAGATAGTQTISAGKLIAIAPGNPGSGYSGSDTVTVSGGIGTGTPGGGTAVGGNGGRLTAV